ncbi:hypothetical protein GCM10029992_09670 [Glycomyces albus]
MGPPLSSGSSGPEWVSSIVEHYVEVSTVEELAIQNAADGEHDGPAPAEVDEAATQTIREAYAVMADLAAETECPRPGLRAGVHTRPQPREER